MEAVSLVPLEKEGNRYQHYAGKWFTLDSTADGRLTRRIIVRVEQIFAAYRQMLSPRRHPRSRRGWSSSTRWTNTRRSLPGGE